MAPPRVGKEIESLILRLREEEMERLNIKIVGVKEMRLHFSGTSNGDYQYGVGLIAEKNIAKHVIIFVFISERTK
jgi:hypothetical protein